MPLFMPKMRSAQTPFGIWAIMKKDLSCFLCDKQSIPTKYE